MLKLYSFLAARFDFLGDESHFWVPCFFLLNCLGGWNQQMWLVSCTRQGMLTQGLAPDPKCKLNISSLLTLPHLLDCLICTRNSASIVLLLWIMGGWDRWGKVDSYQGVNIISAFFCFVFAFVCWSLMSCLFFKWVEHDSFCLFLCLLFVFSVSGPFN